MSETPKLYAPSESGKFMSGKFMEITDLGEVYAKGRADQLAADRPYMQHQNHCRIHYTLNGERGGCSCGLAAHLAERTD